MSTLNSAMVSWISCVNCPANGAEWCGWRRVFFRNPRFEEKQTHGVSTFPRHSEACHTWPYVSRPSLISRADDLLNPCKKMTLNMRIWGKPSTWGWSSSYKYIDIIVIGGPYPNLWRLFPWLYQLRIIINTIIRSINHHHCLAYIYQY